MGRRTTTSSSWHLVVFEGGIGTSCESRGNGYKGVQRRAGWGAATVGVPENEREGRKEGHVTLPAHTGKLCGHISGPSAPGFQCVRQGVLALIPRREASAEASAVIVLNSSAKARMPLTQINLSARLFASTFYQATRRASVSPGLKLISSFARSQ